MKITTALLALALALPIVALPIPGVKIERCVGTGRKYHLLVPIIFILTELSRLYLTGKT
ncbi:hypothetical protein BD410DRAFT_779392 [Rickenella mellea]|uniref:Uncharacterized protein n=1 Tax=Rickenella mellea TaxID=50990 RepID=A0A4R5XEV9_9AGAM|nr:hypothetical protein BD410DRAFT_779392 [Rickenella mellea]